MVKKKSGNIIVFVKKMEKKTQAGGAVVKMCVVVVLQGMHDVFPLIVLHGRDEFFARATLPVAVRDGLVCGIDCVAKGTWCGLNTETGRAVFLTNFRTVDLPVEKPVKSRGMLVLDLLREKDVSLSEFGLCNVLVLNNCFVPLAPIVHENNATGERSLLKPGVAHALSNSVRTKRGFVLR